MGLVFLFLYLQKERHFSARPTSVSRCHYLFSTPPCSCSSTLKLHSCILQLFYVRTRNWCCNNGLTSSEEENIHSTVTSWCVCITSIPVYHIFFSLSLQNHILHALDLAISDAFLFIREYLRFLKNFEF